MKIRKKITAHSVCWPWARLNINGHKDVENRTSPPAETRINKRIAIHAPQKRRITKEEYLKLLEAVKECGIRKFPMYIDGFEYAAIVGTTFHVGADKTSKPPWPPKDASHWEVENSKRFRPLTAKSKQFWFSVKSDLFTLTDGADCHANQTS